LITPALSEAFDLIAGDIKGFYFGRFDIKVPNAQCLCDGSDIQVIELNGVTSEATHIYEPGASLWGAYRTLAKQWQMAFEIGAINQKNGTETVSFYELLKLIYQYKIRPSEKPDSTASAFLNK